MLCKGNHDIFFITPECVIIKTVNDGFTHVVLEATT